MIQPQSPRSDADWRTYYQRTGDRPPRPTLLFALDQFAAPGVAVDLGCGGGRDVVEVLRRGWTVWGVDQAATAGEEILARSDLPATGEFHFVHGRYEHAAWPLCDLVNSSFALPLCPTEGFARVWLHVEQRLRPGGRFSGQLYGPRDSWFGREGLTFHTKAEVETLFDRWELELFDEEEDDSTTPSGTPKHWHIWHIVARKP